MASSPLRAAVPTTPHGPGGHLQRSFTAPVKQNTFPNNRTGVPPADAERVEGLYAHAHARIVKFDIPASLGKAAGARARGSIDGSAGIQGSQLVPWRYPSHEEKLIAVGPISIHRVKGSVSFLNSGIQILLPLMPRTQCWCVDDAGTFVLRKGQSYHRLELPCETDLDRAQVEELKRVLSSVLLFEKTSCPFRKGVGEELPDPDTPTRRKGMKPQGKAKRWNLDRRVWRPEDYEERQRLEEERRAQYGDEGDASASASESSVAEDSGVESSEPETKQESEQETESQWESAYQTFAEVRTTPLRPKSLSSSARSITAPPQLTLKASPPSKSATTNNETYGSISSSLESFYSVNSALPPSPPASEPDSSTSDYIEAAEPTPRAITHGHTRDVSTTSTIIAPAPAPPSLNTNLPPSSPGYENLPTTANLHNPLQPQTYDSPVQLDNDKVPEHADEHDNAHDSIPSTPDLLTTTAEDADWPTEVVTPPDSIRLRSLPKALQNAPTDQTTTTTTSTSTSTSSKSGTTAGSTARLRPRPSHARLHQMSSRMSLRERASHANLALANASHSQLVGQGTAARTLLSCKGIVSTALEILLRPPSHLVELMLQFAARVSKRVGRWGEEWDGEELDLSAGFGRKAPGAWETSEDEGGEESEDDEGFETQEDGRVVERGRRMGVTSLGEVRRRKDGRSGSVD